MVEELQRIIDLSKGWIVENGIEVLAVILITWIISHFLGFIIGLIVRKMVPHAAFPFESEEKKREDTLITIIKGFLSIFIWIGALFFILNKFGIPIAPLITGAGIVGVAVGFGSQSLVKDVITGMFIIAENQFRIGDVISVGQYSGTVEGMTLRVTKLRELNGTIHYVPNGEIKVASNESKDYSVVDIKIGVGYDTDIDYLEKVINKTGEELANDPDYKDDFIEAPKFLRIEELSDYAITARILGKVYPKQQYEVAGEFRKRLKKSFEEANIDIPYPTSVIRTINS